MEKYYCPYCEYSADTPSTFERHTSTKKHIQNMETSSKKINYDITKKITRYCCNNCDKEFGSNTTKWRHEKTCGKEDTIVTPIGNEKSIIEEVFKKVMACQNKFNEDIISKLLAIADKNTTVMEKTADVANKNADVANKSMNMLKYANIHLKDASPMKTLERNEVYGMIGYDNPENLEEENEKYVKLVLSNYENNNIAKFFGDLIVNYYKEDDVKDVRFWSADVARLCFIIMQTVNKKGEKEWSDDKSGKKFTAMVITPMFDTLKHILEIFLKFKKTWENHNKNPSVSQMGYVMELRQNSVNLIKDLKYNKYEQAVLKIVAPSFHFDTYKKIKTLQLDLHQPTSSDESEEDEKPKKIKNQKQKKKSTTNQKK